MASCTSPRLGASCLPLRPRPASLCGRSTPKCPVNGRSTPAATWSTVVSLLGTARSIWPPSTVALSPSMRAPASRCGISPPSMPASPTPSPVRRAWSRARCSSGRAAASSPSVAICPHMTPRPASSTGAGSWCRAIRPTVSRTSRWRWPPRPGAANGGKPVVAVRPGIPSFMTLRPI